MAFKLKHSQYFLGFFISLGVMGVPGVPVIAAETVVLKYSIFQLSVPISTLETLAATGEMSSQLNTLFKLGKVSPNSVREALTGSISVSATTLDTGLSSPPGQLVLDQVSQVIHTPSRTEDRKALKSALILAASDDNKITLLETLQKYPTQEVHVDGKRLVDAYKTLAKFGKGLDQVTERLQELLNKIKLPNL